MSNPLYQIGFLSLACAIIIGYLDISYRIFSDRKDRKR